MPTTELPDGSYSALNSGDLDTLPGYPVVLHAAPLSALEQILTQGLQPGRPSAHRGLMAPRPGCVYFASPAMTGHGWLEEWAGIPSDEHALTLGVDLTTIDVRRILPDEDSFFFGPTPDTDDWPEWDDTQHVPLGHWAEDLRLGAQPGVTAAAVLSRNTLAIRGPIPADLLTVHDPTTYQALGSLTSWASPTALREALAAHR